MNIKSISVSLCLLTGVSFSLRGNAIPDDTVKVQKVITITGVGDIMFGTTYPSARFLPPHDNPLLLLGDLADTLAASDITFGNLEGSFLNNGEPCQRNAGILPYVTFSGCRKGIPEHLLLPDLTS